MTKVQLQPLKLAADLKSDEVMLGKINTSLSTIIKQTSTRDIEIIENQSGKFSKFADGVNEILNKSKNLKTSCAANIDLVDKETVDLQAKILAYQTQFNKTNKAKILGKQKEELQRKYLSAWQKRIQLASQVDTTKFSEIDIEDRKSKANEVFKWIIVAIYGEAESKFYWPNFLEQIFQKGEGADFKERLGKINSSNATKQQKLKTAQFLKMFDQIKSSPQLEAVHSQLDIFRQIAQIYMNCYEIASKIRQLEKGIAGSEQTFGQKDEQAMRWRARCEALIDQNKVKKQYFDILTTIETKLVKKAANYKQKQSTAKEILQKLRKNQISFNEIENRSKSDCKIF